MSYRLWRLIYVFPGQMVYVDLTVWHRLCATFRKDVRRDFLQHLFQRKSVAIRSIAKEVYDSTDSSIHKQSLLNLVLL